MRPEGTQCSPWPTELRVTGARTHPTPPHMADSRLKSSERALQVRFSFRRALTALFLLVFLPLTLSGDQSVEKPDRTPRPEQSVAIRYTPLPWDRDRAGSVRVAGVWRVEADDVRLGGMSGLASADGHLLAVTDSGTIIGLPRPGEEGAATFRDLPAGPGSPFWKKYRDAESLAPANAGQGWWVGFEFQHSLYLFDREFRRPLRRLLFAKDRWSANAGVEALANEGGDLLLIPETGREVLRLRGGTLSSFPLAGAQGAPADAVSLADGRILVLLRQLRPWGLVNRIAQLRRDGRGYRLRSVGVVPLGRLDNVEGIAAEPRPNGGTRLWLITDNDFSKRRRTLLIAVDTAPKRRRRGA